MRGRLRLTFHRMIKAVQRKKFHLSTTDFRLIEFTANSISVNTLNVLMAEQSKSDNSTAAFLHALAVSLRSE